METKEFSVIRTLKDAYAIAEDKLWQVVGQFAVLFLSSVLLLVLAGDNALLSIVISALFSLASVIFGLTYAYGSNFTFDMLTEKITFKIFSYYLLASIAVSALTIVGLAALVVPGVIIMSMLLFTPHLILNKSLKPIDAMKESRRMTKGYRGKLLLLVLASIPVNIAGAICFGVGLFFTIPLTLIAFSLAYKTILNRPAPAPETSATEAIHSVQ